MAGATNHMTNSSVSIELENFSLYYDISVPLLKEVNYRFKGGNIYGIVGPSGQGKTSLFRMLSGIGAFYGLKNDGKYEVNYSNSGPNDLKRKLAFVFQHTEKELNPIRKLKSHFNDIGVDINSPAFKNLLENFGLESSLLDHYPFMNSGGQNQRFGWLLHWSQDPDILLLDEPVAHVDVELKKILSQKIKDFARQEDKLVLVISHEMEWLSSLCDKIIRIERQQLVEVEEYEANKTVIELKKPDDNILLKVSKISFGYFADQSILHDFNLSIKIGERVGLKGTSGKGKSTLLKIINGDLEPREGKLDWTVTDKAERVVLVGQNSYEEFNPLYSIDNTLKEFRKKFNFGEKDLHLLLDQFGLELDVLHLKPLELSGGQMQRLALIKALLIRPKMLLLDESFNGMDDDLIEDITGQLIEYCDRVKCALVLVMHREEILHRICHRIVDMDKL